MIEIGGHQIDLHTVRLRAEDLPHMPSFELLSAADPIAKIELLGVLLKRAGVPGHEVDAIPLGQALVWIEALPRDVHVDLTIPIHETLQ